MKNTIVIGLLGPVLDDGTGIKRWDRWRPTIGLCQQEDLLVSRFDLLYQRKFSKLCDVIIEDIHNVSPETIVIKHEIKLENPWDFEEVYGVLHDFSKYYLFDTEKEDYLIHITTGTHVAQICLYLLTESGYFPAKLLQTSPSSEDICGKYTIIDLDLSKYDRIATRFKQEIKDDISFLKSGIETRNRQFNDLIEQIERVASNSIDPILLTGPTGAGKSHLAKRIYELKKLKHKLQGKFIEVNCATIRGDAALSSLFGHKKGAFTGAIQDREGLLRAAEGGMLFLDEIGELGLDEQSMLLRAIEEKCFLPVGSDKETSSNFQLICGTNRDLLLQVEKGKFREDLLSRINLWTFTLPGLKNRSEDIEPNLKFELDRLSQRNNIHINFSKEAFQHFLSFATSSEATWSANFRDLNGAVTRMATLSLNGRITIEIVKEEIKRLLSLWYKVKGCNEQDILIQILGEAKVKKLDRFEKIQLADVLSVCQKSKSISEAGRTMFAASRNEKKKTNDSDRLKKYLSKYSITWNSIQKIII
ncbi:MAG: sigma 54-interacting transcriptional regulator [Desulfobacterales bacterium]|nr:sigma 54-interacting transcriptional regulator [Desulfobacterales bacterium]